MVAQILKEYTGPVLASIAGIYSLRFLNGFWRILFIQPLIYLLVLTLSYVVTPPRSTNSNEWLYNIYILVEFCLLYFAEISYFKSNLSRYLIHLFFAMFCVVAVLQIMFNGPLVLAGYAYSFGALSAILFFSLLMYREAADPTFILYNPLFLASAGLVLYFACNMPFFAFYSWLKKFPRESRLIYAVVNDVLAISRYLLLGVAFLLVRKNMQRQTGNGQ